MLHALKTLALVQQSPNNDVLWKIYPSRVGLDCYLLRLGLAGAVAQKCRVKLSLWDPGRPHVSGSCSPT